jgi:sugar phosphate isomerase/epimerase
MNRMTLRDRIGIDCGNKLAAEDAVVWAGEHGLRYIDLQADFAPNALPSFDAARCARIRELSRQPDVRLGLHTLSAVNIAELSPFVGDAVDAYLRGYIDLAFQLACEWVVVHGGYHFTADREARQAASIARLQRATEYAQTKGVVLLLENLNREPERAEVHYLASTLAEMQAYFAAIPSPFLRWSFTVNHATLEPEGIDGFLDALPFSRLHEVRLADNNGEYELHMRPGEGIIDFAALFQRLEGQGFTGHYMAAFGTLDDMLAGRDVMAAAGHCEPQAKQSP